MKKNIGKARKNGLIIPWILETYARNKKQKEIRNDLEILSKRMSALKVVMEEGNRTKKVEKIAEKELIKIKDEIDRLEYDKRLMEVYRDFGILGKRTRREAK